MTTDPLLNASPALAKPSPANSDLGDLKKALIDPSNIVKSWASSIKETEGYRYGFVPGLGPHPVPSVEISSWLQVPGVLQALQNATRQGRTIDIRLNFPHPPSGDPRAAEIASEQAEIKKFFQTSHACPSGEALSKLQQKLSELSEKSGLPGGLSATDWLKGHEGLHFDDKSILKVTDVIDLSASFGSKDRASDTSALQVSLTRAIDGRADERPIALLLGGAANLEGVAAQTLVNLFKAYKQEGRSLEGVKVWLRDRGHANTLKELSVEELLGQLSDQPAQPAQKNEKQSKDTTSAFAGGAATTATAVPLAAAKAAPETKSAPNDNTVEAQKRDPLQQSTDPDHSTAQKERGQKEDPYATAPDYDAYLARQVASIRKVFGHTRQGDEVIARITESMNALKKYAESGA
jgi:hypothetical protein